MAQYVKVNPGGVYCRYFTTSEVTKNTDGSFTITADDYNFGKDFCDLATACGGLPGYAGSGVGGASTYMRLDPDTTGNYFRIVRQDHVDPPYINAGNNSFEYPVGGPDPKIYLAFVQKGTSSSASSYAFPLVGSSDGAFYSTNQTTNRQPLSLITFYDDNPDYVEPVTAAETPTITKNLPLFGKVTYEQGDVADTLAIEAEVSDGGTLTYQWYKDDAAIDGATESSYTPSVEVGSAVYYCVVTNTLGEANATAQSESVAIIGYVVFLAASEPVPVGTAPKIDPFSMTLGWLIGSRIAGQRGQPA